MKKILLVAAAFLVILILTRIANQVPPPQPPGTTFWLKAQTVVQCDAEKITLVDPREKSTLLYKDESWPDCAAFQKDMVLDFQLARGEKTRFLSIERTAWWRKAL